MIPWAKPRITNQDKQLVTEALDSTWVSGGPFVDRFERAFADLHGVGDAITTSNGTTALMLAMLALNLRPGDEVIVPAFGFMAPANMVIALGATPVFVEVLADTWCIDPKAAHRAVTAQTRAVVATHTYGNVCDLATLRALCDSKRIALIEDCAEAAFSEYRHKYVGTIGDFGCFSFQATKTITTGEGGIVLARDTSKFDMLRLIRSHGMSQRRYWHLLIGHNFRLTNMQAALGCSQLGRLNEICCRRLAMQQKYAARLVGIDGLALQTVTDGALPIPWAVAVQLEPRAFGERDGVLRRMLDVGVETRPGFYAASQMPLYCRFIDKSLDVSEDVASKVLVLPSFPELTDDEIDRVCENLLEMRL